MAMNNSMIFLAAICVCAAPATLRADPLEADYLKARDAYVARFDPGDKQVDADKIDKLQKPALADLQARLRKIIGRLRIKGATGEGTINMDTLLKGDMGYGALDALAYKIDGGRAQVVATTSGLVANWLDAHKAWWDKGEANVPPEAHAALRFDGFYTQALVGDAAITKFADLPVATPTGADFAVAMLDRRQQADFSGAPDEIIVALMREGRLTIVTEPAQPKLAPIAACEKVWKDYEDKANAQMEGAPASASKDEAAGNDSETTRADGDRAFRACYGEKVKALAAYPKLLAQAQRLLDAAAGH
jgi:hypothetical protein